MIKLKCVTLFVCMSLQACMKEFHDMKVAALGFWPLQKQRTLYYIFQKQTGAKEKSSSCILNLKEETTEDGIFPTLNKYSPSVKKAYLFSQPRELLLYISSI